MNPNPTGTVSLSYHEDAILRIIRITASILGDCLEQRIGYDYTLNNMLQVEKQQLMRSNVGSKMNCSTYFQPTA